MMSCPLVTTASLYVVIGGALPYAQDEYPTDVWIVLVQRCVSDSAPHGAMHWISALQRMIPFAPILRDTVREFRNGLATAMSGGSCH